MSELKTVYRDHSDNDYVITLETVAPTLSVMPLATAKTYLKVQHTGDDGIIQDFINIAIDKVQKHCMRSLGLRTLKTTFQGDEYWKKVPFIPYGSISLVRRMEDNPVTLVLDTDYIEKGNAEDFYIHTNPKRKLSTGTIPYDIEVTYTSGYATLPEVPGGLIEALYLMVANLYSFRDLIENDAMSVNITKTIHAKLFTYVDGRI